MNNNKNYFDSVNEVFRKLKLDQLIIEYFCDDFNDLMDETKIIIDKIFAESNITIEQANIRYREILNNKNLYNEIEKNKETQIKVIGTRRFYEDWMSYKKTCSEFNFVHKDISCIEYYENSSKPLTEEERQNFQQQEDEFYTAVHYGKYKSKK